MVINGFRMIFSLSSDVEFEADNIDQALIKLALHFMSRMEAGPILLINDNPPIDMVKIIQSGITPLTDDDAAGYIDIDVHGDFEPPAMMQ